MKLGELLIKAGLINQQQLSQGLEYGMSKCIPLGSVLKLLKILSDEQVSISLEFHNFVKKGMDTELCVQLLQKSLSEKLDQKQRILLCRTAFKEFYEKASKEKAQEEAALEVLAKAATKTNIPNNETAIPQNEEKKATETLRTSFIDLTRIGDQYLAENKLKESEAAYKEARILSENAFGKGEIQTAKTLLKLANLYLVSNRFDEAESLYQEIISIKRKFLGEAHPELGASIEDLADLYDARTEYDRAALYFELAIGIREQHLPNDSDEFIGLIRKLHRSLSKSSVKGGASERIAKRTGELLTQAGLLDSTTLQKALKTAKRSNRPIGIILREQRLVKPRQLNSVLAAQNLLSEGQASEFVISKLLKVSLLQNLSFADVVSIAGISVKNNTHELLSSILTEQERLLDLEMELGADNETTALQGLILIDLYLRIGNLPAAESLFKSAKAILAKSQPEKLNAVTLKLAQALITCQRALEGEEMLMGLMKSLSEKNHSKTADMYYCLISLSRSAILQGNNNNAANFLRSALSILPNLDEPKPKTSRSDFQWMKTCLEEADLSEHANILMPYLTET